VKKISKWILEVKEQLEGWQRCMGIGQKQLTY